MHVSADRPRWCEKFTRLNAEHIRRRRIATFDMETDDGTLLGKPAGICFTSDIDFPKYETFTQENPGCMIRLLTHFLVKRYRGFVAYAHKGMAFDVSHLLSSAKVQRWLTARGFSVRVDRSFAVIRRGKHSWYLGDSLRMFPVKLADVLNTFAPHYTKAPLPTVPFSWHHHEWRERILSDTLGLYESLVALQKIMLDTFGIPLSLTMPSTALRAARTMLPVESIQRPGRKALDWIRAGAYSGGRIEVFQQGKVNGHITIYDINSAYAWALKGLFPCGKERYTLEEPAHGDIAIGRCSVSVPPDTDIPPVLSRLFHHAFCVGDFQAMLTNEEITFARECGASVEWIEGFTWKESLPIFRAFIEKCETLRRKDYAGPLGHTVKLAQNGLYGILGMNPFRKVQMLSVEPPPRPWVHAFDDENGTYLPNVWETTLFQESPNMMPHWATIITARVRVHLTRYLLTFKRAGLEPLYAHTDSIWAWSGNGIPQTIQQLCADEYGMLKKEADGTEAIIVGPGQAAVKLTDATWHIAAKGIDNVKPEMFFADSPTKITQVQVFRAGTALKRQSVGRIVPKIVMNYDAMRNRVTPKHRPGSTTPHTAKPYVYGYWSFPAWRIGKLQMHPPIASNYLSFVEQQKLAEVRKHRRSQGAVQGARKRIEREFYEGYEQWLQEPAWIRQKGLSFHDNRSHAGRTR